MDRNWSISPNQKRVKKPNISKVRRELVLNLEIWVMPILSLARFCFLLWWFHFLPLLPLHGGCQSPLRLPHLSFTTNEKLFVFSDHVWKIQVNDLFAQFDISAHYLTNYQWDRASWKHRDLLSHHITGMSKGIIGQEAGVLAFYSEKKRMLHKQLTSILARTCTVWVISLMNCCPHVYQKWTKTVT